MPLNSFHSKRAETEALFFEGNRFLEAGNDLRAETCFTKAVQIAPEFAEAHANLGFLLDKRGALDEAEASYRRSVRLAPANPRTHLNFGALLARRKRFQEAEASYWRAIALGPVGGSAAGWSNLGMLYASINREAEAERCLRTAMAQDQNYAKARFNLSYLLLRQGRFEEGWRCHDARKNSAALAQWLSCPRWRGETLAGKSILISIEAGHGDMIQFCRYAAVLKQRGAASISLLCHPGLKALFASLKAVDTVISVVEEITESGWDFWIPALSLPHYCHTRIDSIPARIPYLHAQPEHIAKWVPSIPQDGLRVALVWKGNPKFEYDPDRSLPSLEVLAPLWGVAGVHYISLQKGAGENEAARPPEGQPLVELGSRIVDFADSAAIVASVDLVVCVDTAMAHLAGAMGRPCWVLLSAYMPDWRWLTGREDSPWYPKTMRLFRQPAIGDWQSVVERVGAELRALRGEGQPPPIAVLGQTP